MKKIVISLIAIFLMAVAYMNSYATTKDDIIGYVNGQSVCGDTGLFNSYKATFTRLLKQKKLTDSELASVYSYLQKSVGILHSRGVCKLSDLDKLTEKEKNAVYNNLMAGASIITNAPKLTFDEKTLESENSNSKQDKNNNKNVQSNESDSSKNNKNAVTSVILNTETDTMDIYENGVLVDKISMSSSKMTYTGINVRHVIITSVCITIFVFSLILFIKLYNRHTAKTRFVKNILVSLMIFSIGISFTLIIFGTKIDTLKGMLNLLTVNLSDEKYEIELNEDKTIKTYPSYGLNYGTLEIPSVKVEKNIYFGDSSDILSLGIGHSTWSDMPTEGGVVVFSGHNNKDTLNNIKDVKKQDKIVVDTTYAKCTYIVKSTDILNSSEVDKLVKKDNKETLVIYTCYPFDTYVYTEKRFVVFATLDSVEWK